METILFVCAHNDDQIIGGGGTFAKYAKEGKAVKTVIFSYGEKSHPHLKRKVIVQKRLQEARESNKILGGKDLIFLGLNEGKFLKEAQTKEVREQLAELIKKEQPTKIFTHSVDDPHPDHQAVHKIMFDIIHGEKLRMPVYTFDIWNPLKVLKRNVPKLVVDVTKTFQLKLEAYEAHESQVNLPALLPFRIRMYVDAWLNGWANNCKYAEVFHKMS
jgi:LmbE family N-acetylglucosaminyl deacetylase